METSLQVSQAYMKSAKEAREHPTDLPGIPYGLPSLDKMTGGIRRNQLTILGAETGAGKTLIMEQMALTIARWLKDNQPDKVIRIMHCEMTLEQVRARHVTAITGIPEEKISRGATTDEEHRKVYEANLELAKLPIEYLPEPGSIRECVDFVRADDNCVWWGLDHIQELQPGGNRSPIDMQAMSDKAQAFARLAKNFCSGMVLSQLTKEVSKREDHRPTKDDLFGGKMLQAPASVILLLYRPDLYTVNAGDKQNEPKQCHLSVGKNRNGPLGDIKLVFNPARAMFVDAGGKK